MVIALGAGYIGAALNCDENSEGCDVAGFPSVVEPWTWSDYDAFPEVFVIGLLGLAGAALLVVFVVRRNRGLAAVAFVSSAVLLSYPFFAGLTEEGRLNFVWGFALGLGAVLANTRRTPATRSPS